MVLVCVLAGCTSVHGEGDCGIGAACARKAPRTDQQPHREPTVYPKQVLTGTITDGGEGSYLSRWKPGSWILVEEDPDADCRGDQGPLKPGCQKMYFDIGNDTRVLREEGNDRKAAKPADLKEGQRVSADYTGNDVAMSYPSQTSARWVVILVPS